MRERTFLLCLDSVREWDPRHRRTRFVGGPQKPTPREGHGWHHYEAMSRPVTGQPTTITWWFDDLPGTTQKIARSTRTNTFVAALPVNPSAGPWALHYDDPTQAVEVRHADEPIRIWVTEPEAGWLLSCYLNLALTLNQPPSAVPQFSGFTHNDERAIVTAADHPVAVLDPDHLDRVLDELGRLPQNVIFPMALRGAVAGHSWSEPIPVWRLPPEHMIPALIAGGVTDTELTRLIEAGPKAIRAAAKRAGELEAQGHPWVETAAILRRERMI